MRQLLGCHLFSEKPSTSPLGKSHSEGHRSGNLTKAGKDLYRTLGVPRSLLDCEKRRLFLGESYRAVLRNGFRLKIGETINCRFHHI